MVTLKASSLLAAEDAGARVLPDEFVSAFSRLAESLDGEADLTLVGRRLIQNQLLRIVRQRRSLEQQEIRPWEVEPRIVVIVGLPRTGTTLLHHLIAHCCETDFVPLWEALEPFVVAGAPHSPSRPLRADHYLRFIDRLSPQLRKLHPMGVDTPDECDVALQLSALSDWFAIAHRCHSYSRWAEREPRAQSLAVYRRLLTAIRPHAGSLVLKSPSHLAHLGDLFATFSRCRVIWLHRPRREVVPSFVRLVHAARAVTCDPGSFSAIRREWLPRLEARIEAGSPWLDDQRVLNVHYDDLLHDTAGTLTSISAFSGLLPRSNGPTPTAIAEQLRSAMAGRNGHSPSRDLDVGPETDLWLSRAVTRRARPIGAGDSRRAARPWPARPHPQRSAR